MTVAFRRLSLPEEARIGHGKVPFKFAAQLPVLSAHKGELHRAATAQTAPSGQELAGLPGGALRGRLWAQQACARATASPPPPRRARRGAWGAARRRPCFWAPGGPRCAAHQPGSASALAPNGATGCGGASAARRPWHRGRARAVWTPRGHGPWGARAVPRQRRVPAPGRPRRPSRWPRARGGRVRVRFRPPHPLATPLPGKLIGACSWACAGGGFARKPGSWRSQVPPVLYRLHGATVVLPNRR